LKKANFHVATISTAQEESEFVADIRSSVMELKERRRHTIKVVSLQKEKEVLEVPDASRPGLQFKRSIQERRKYERKESFRKNRGI